MIYDPDNIFAQVLRGDIPSTAVYEDQDVYAFRDITPAAPVHVLIIPKGEYSSFSDFAQKADPVTIGRFYQSVQKVAEQLGVDENGYRLLTNHGRDASQSVPHFHVHLLAGRPLGGLLPGDAAAR